MQATENMSKNPHIPQLFRDIFIGMRISSEKTIFSDDVINSSIKADKLFWLTNSSENWNIEKHLLIIKKLSDKYKNSGTLEKELQNFYKKIYNRKNFRNIGVLISIITDIAFNNPRTYSISVSILGKFISSLEKDNDKKNNIAKVKKKIEKLPNTEVVDLWLQRLTLKFDRKKKYQGNLSNKVTNTSQEVWNSEWLNDNIKKVMNEVEIIDQKKSKKWMSILTWTKFLRLRVKQVIITKRSNVCARIGWVR